MSADRAPPLPSISHLSLPSLSLSLPALLLRAQLHVFSCGPDSHRETAEFHGPTDFAFELTDELGDFDKCYIICLGSLTELDGWARTLQVIEWPTVQLRLSVSARHIGNSLLRPAHRCIVLYYRSPRSVRTTTRYSPA